MKIGSVTAQGRGETDRLLSSLVEELDGKIRLVGIVQTNSDRLDCVGCDMDVRVLPTGQVFRISQALGPQATGCRLDAAALEQSVGIVQSALSEGADLLILNKFGKQEASGRGFRPLISTALEAGIPVMAGLNETNRDAFEQYADGFSEAVAPTLDALLDWVSREVREPTSIPKVEL